MNENKNVRLFAKYSYLLLFESMQNSKNDDLEEIGCLAKNFDDFMFSTPNAVCSRGAVLLKLTELIVDFGLVHSLEGVEDRDFSESDFPFQAEQAVHCFQFLPSLLDHYDTIETSYKRKFLVQVLMLCGTHNNKYLWSSDASVTECTDFLKNLLSCTKHQTLSVLLTDDTFHPTVFKALLRWMRPCLMKDTWMRIPSSCYIFYWLLSHVKHPYLADYLPNIVPPSFMFTSYHSLPQIILGVKCFDHILDNVPPTLLKTDGTEEVIFDVLKKISSFNKEKVLVEVIYPCMLKLPMMNIEKADQTRWLHFDMVLQQLMDNATMESGPELRCIYLSHINLCINIGPCFKHLSKALNVVYNNLTSNSVLEEECRIVSLKILKELIHSCWPRMENHCFDIMLALLKVFYDVESTYDNVKVMEVLKLCEECIFMLKFACPETFKVSVGEYIEGDDSSLPGTMYLKKLIET